MLFVTVADAGVVTFQNKAGEFLAVHFGEDGQHVGETAVGDPHLLTVQNPMLAVRAQPRGGFRAQRVRTRTRFAQAIGADPFAAADLGQVLGFLFMRAEQNDGQQPDAAGRAEAGRERGLAGHKLSDQHVRDVIQFQSAVFFGNVGVDETEIGGLFDQAALNLVILAFDQVVLRDDFFVKEFLRRLPDHPLFIGEIFGRIHRAGLGLLQEEPAAFDDFFFHCCCCHDVCPLFRLGFV